jgi:hypothetical protein
MSLSPCVRESIATSTLGAIPKMCIMLSATRQAREMASARYERTLFPVALQALVRCFSMAEEEIRWDTQVYSKLLNLWE